MSRFGDGEYWRPGRRCFKEPWSGRSSGLLGGAWDLVTSYNWAYKPTYSPPRWAEGA